MTDQAPTNETPTETKEETYSKTFVEKVLTEKKNAMSSIKALEEKVSMYESQLKEKEEAILKEQNNWKGVSEIKEKEALTWKQKFEEKVQSEHKLIKLGALKKEFEKVGVKNSDLVDQLAGLINFDQIKFDETTNVTVGADEEVKRLKAILPPQVFGVQQTAGAQHAAPQGIPSSVSVENYKNMMKDGSWNKMKRSEQLDYEKKLWGSLGVERK